MGRTKVFGKGTNELLQRYTQFKKQVKFCQWQMKIIAKKTLSWMDLILVLRIAQKN
jgi:hypothetical protein